MGLTHLVDVGHRNLDAQRVEETISQIMAESETSKADGKVCLMSPKFQCEILRCAAELTKFSIWAIFAYVKQYVDIAN